MSQQTLAVRQPSKADRLSLRAEASRKAIHMASALIPALVWVLPREGSIAILGLGAAIAVMVEVARRYSRPFRLVFLRMTRGMLRDREREGVSGATWMAIAYLAAVLLFPLPVAVVAMLYNAFGDGLAAIIGKRFGRLRVAGGKSLEGAAAGFAANFVAGLAVPGIPVVAAATGGAAAAILELLPIPIDDNLVVTLGGGAALWMMMG